ncbi:MAG: hypothetical protein E7198_09525 [Schwartzia succinivorans]|jgi:hypothetical protein|uniref:hypothetical protein n=1 Tax=Schwartzia succinivorans TaxID=55507 RepID=UPI002355DE0A|nr:hypothetical protein [Schwartzia succinivorans]MBE6098019.1 hypothetical protein [Schwartzia succinivorans]
MSQIFFDEHHLYEIDFSSAPWATDRLHDIFHKAGLTIWHDVDWVVETNDELLLVEYKNANHPNARDVFNPLKNEKLDNVAKKYYESSYFLQAARRVEQKKKKFVYILEHKDGDSVMLNMVRNQLISRLPFRLQNQFEEKLDILSDNHFVLSSKWIEAVEVLSIKEWNKNYPQFPLKRV